MSHPFYWKVGGACCNMLPMETEVLSGERREAAVAANAYIPPTPLQMALEDAWSGIRSWRIWLRLAWIDVAVRYRSSKLGPFWITLSMAITVGSMGMLYARLFKSDLGIYLPYLASGMMVWSLMLSLVLETTNAFLEAEGFIKQIKLPFCLYILRVVARCAIVFFHNCILMVPLYLLFWTPPSWSILALFPALCILGFNALCYGIVLASVGARFRDIFQIISSAMQLVFFVTPVMWNTQILQGRYLLWVKYNPFAQFMELVRSPLLGTVPSLHAVACVLVVTVVGALTGLACLKRCRHRIAYWV